MNHATANGTSLLNYYDFGTTTNGQYFVFKFMDTTGSAPNSGGNNLFMAVPEPSTYGLIGAGALAAVAMVRRRRRSSGV